MHRQPATYAWLLAGASACALASPAFAQAPPQAPAAATNLEEVLVTAERREQSLQDVPLAVDVASAATIERANITNVTDLGRLMPSLQITNYFTYVLPFIRGIGSNQATAGNETAVALYVDDVYFARLPPGLLQLNNVDRVEVLSGPQGTLFGRNAAAGLIHVITKEPVPGGGTELKVTAGYGNFDTKDLSIYGAVSLRDDLALDVSWYSSNQDNGWGTNVFDNSEFMLGNSYSARAKLVYQPTDSTKAVLTGFTTYLKGNIGGFVAYRPKQPKPNGSTGRDLPGLGFYDTNINFPSENKDNTWGGSLKVEHDFGFARAVSVTAGQTSRLGLFIDNDYSAESFGELFLPNKDHQFTQELQLQSAPSSKLTWTVGGFYFWHQAEYPASTFFRGSDFGLPPGFELRAPATGTTRSYAIYSQATYPVTDKLNITGGARYTWDHLEGNGSLLLVSPDSSTPLSASSAKDKVGSFSWRAGVDYDISPAIMVYGTISRGNKSALYNLLTFDPNLVRPQTLTSYEVGFKSEFFDHRARLNASAFYYDIKDYQAQFIKQASVVLTNAGRARNKGFDVTASAVLTDKLILRAAATVSDAYFTEFDAAPSWLINPNPPFGLLGSFPRDVAGNQLGQAPRFKGSIGLNYSTDVSLGKMDVDVNYNYTSSHFWDPDNLIKQGSVGILDLSIGFRAQSGFGARVWATNLTNRKYYMGENEQPGTVGITTAPAAPRLYGIRLSYEYK
jgi:iron complex outermembrane receptor protein